MNTFKSWMSFLRDPLGRKALERARNRYIAGMFESERRRTAFKAAESSRLNEQWTITGNTQNEILKTNLQTMRNRSRSLLRNNAHAVGAVNSMLSFVIGKGLEPQADVGEFRRAVQEDGTSLLEFFANDEWNDRAEQLFSQWQRDCDIAGSPTSPESFVDVQRVAFRKFIEDGEVLCHLVPDKTALYVPLRLELLETDRLDASMLEAPNGNPVQLGVEVDKATGRPVAYWIKGSVHTADSTRIPAEYMIHLFERLRPGQTRGVPIFAPVMERFFELDDYVRYELIACKVAACFSVWIENAPGLTSTGDFLPHADGDDHSSTPATDSEGNPITHVQPGIIGQVPKGTNIHTTQAQKPSSTFGPFTEHLLRAIGTGILGGLSYEAVTRDTSRAKFAGARLAQQMDFQAFQAIQGWFGRKFLAPVWREWIKLAILSGKLPAPGPLNKVDWYRHSWISSGWSVGVNPMQEVNAAREAMRAGMTTLADETPKWAGRDVYTQLRLMAKIKRFAASHGLVLTSDGSISVMNGVDEQTQSEEEAAAENAERIAEMAE